MKSFAQCSQDLDVLHVLCSMKNGFFVDIGAYDGVKFSNTYLLEKDFSWTGIAVEPNPVSFKQLKANRKCKLENCCVVPEKITGKIKFVVYDLYSGIMDVSTDTHVIEYSKQHPESIIEVESKTLGQILIDNNAPKRIDYLSIDTEGNEIDILNAFDFNTYEIGIISAEHNAYQNAKNVAKRDEIRKFLTAKGYRLHAFYGDFDDLFVHSSVKNFSLKERLTACVG